VANEDPDEGTRPFSGTFLLPAGEPLLISSELAAQLPELVGQSYRDIRSAMGVKARGGKDAPKATMTDDGLAVISMIGPVTRYDDWCAWLFGGVSTDSLMDQLQAAIDDPSCRGILLYIDSPGGEAAAIHDLADMIYQAREKKPTVAYVDNLAASAAYWVATGANQIVMSPAAFVGSIGVVTTVWKDNSGRSIEIVSSKSPRKRVDIGTDEGRAVIQSRIDDLADVFIGAVARHRGVEASTVESDFGQGDVLIGNKAVSAGMADAVGDSHAAFAALRELAKQSDGDQNRWGRVPGPKGIGMEINTVEQLTAAYPSLVAQVRADGAAAERDRIKAIRALDTPTNRAFGAEMIDAAMADGSMSAEKLAYQLMMEAGRKNAQMAANRGADAAQVPVVTEKPRTGGASTAEETQSAELGAMIAGFANGNRRPGERARRN
jgi:signal peptide peptidase SppA